jgi:hypothetical protein
MDWIDLAMTGISTGFCQCSNERLGTIKFKEFVD